MKIFVPDPIIIIISYSSNSGSFAHPLSPPHSPCFPHLSSYLHLTLAMSISLGPRHVTRSKWHITDSVDEFNRCFICVYCVVYGMRRCVSLAWYVYDYTMFHSMFVSTHNKYISIETYYVICLLTSTLWHKPNEYELCLTNYYMFNTSAIVIIINSSIFVCLFFFFSVWVWVCVCCSITN